MNKKWTIGEVRSQMNQRGWTPEALAERCGVSHMTVRRLLRRPDGQTVPERYWLQLSVVFRRSAVPSSLVDPSVFREMADDLKREGRKHSLKTVIQRVNRKFEVFPAAKALGPTVERVIHLARARSTPTAFKALALGALMYLVNPMDFIPDIMVSVGLLDDWAVLMLALETALEGKACGAV